MSVFTKNFYSSTQQYGELQLRAFDEGPRIYSRVIGINSSSIDTAAIDPFRQGVEITQEKHTVGLIKISAGTAGHIIKPVSYGINELDIISTGSFVEIDYFDPVRYIKVQEPGVNIYDVVTFPIITADSNQQENYILNGVIEPLTIRPVISFFSIEFPFESHAVKGSMMGGNSDVRRFTSDQILTVDYSPKKLTPRRPRLIVSGTLPLPTIVEAGSVQQHSYINRAWYLDASEHLLSGSAFAVNSDIPPLGEGYVNPDLNVIDPYVDSQVYLKNFGITVETHGEDMVKVFTRMTGSSDNYVTPGKKSGTAGFVYDNIGSVGTDSIAFGGMTY